MSSENQNRERLKLNKPSALDNYQASDISERQDVAVPSKNARDNFDNMSDPVPLLTSRHRQIGQKRQKPRKPALQMYVPPSKRHQNTSKSSDSLDRSSERKHIYKEQKDELDVQDVMVDKTLPVSCIAVDRERVSEAPRTDTVNRYSGDELSINDTASRVHVEKAIRTDSHSSTESRQSDKFPILFDNSSPRKNARREKAIYVPRRQRINESADVYVPFDNKTYHDNLLMSDNAIISYGVCSNDDRTHISSDIPNVMAGGDSYQKLIPASNKPLSTNWPMISTKSSLETHNVDYQYDNDDHYLSSNPQYQIHTDTNAAQYVDAEHMYWDDPIDINDPISEFSKEIQSHDTIHVGYQELYQDDHMTYQATQLCPTSSHSPYINKCPKVSAAGEYPESQAFRNSVNAVYTDHLGFKKTNSNQLDCADSLIHEEGDVTESDASIIEQELTVCWDEFAVDSSAIDHDSAVCRDAMYHEPAICHTELAVDSRVIEHEPAVCHDEVAVYSRTLDREPAVCHNELSVDSSVIEHEPAVCHDEVAVDSRTLDREPAVCHNELSVASSVIEHEPAVCHDEVAVDSKTLDREPAVCHDELAVDSSVIEHETAVCHDEVTVDSRTLDREPAVCQDELAVDSSVIEHEPAVCHDELTVDSRTLDPEPAVCHDEVAVDSRTLDPEPAVCHDELAIDSSAIDHEPAVCCNVLAVDSRDIYHELSVCHDWLVVDHSVMDHEQLEVCHTELTPSLCTMENSELSDEKTKMHELYRKIRSLSQSCPDVVQKLHVDVSTSCLTGVDTQQDNKESSSYRTCSSNKEQLELSQEPSPESLPFQHEKLHRNTSQSIAQDIAPIQTMHNSPINTYVCLENTDDRVCVEDSVSLLKSISTEGAKLDHLESTKSNYHLVNDDSVRSTESDHARHFECKRSELDAHDTRDRSRMSKQAICTDTVHGTNSDISQPSANQSSDKDSMSMQDQDSWECMFDDNGDCLDSDIIKELTAAVGDVKVEHVPIKNYYTYMPKELDLVVEDYSHVIEIYDFPPEFLTRDLILAFSSFMARGFDVKWVDDTHALGIFSSSVAAQDALTLHHPMMKVRSLIDADSQSKRKAQRCVEFLQPYKARPQTTAIAARRLVTGALGLTPRISKEKRELEKQQLKQAKDKRRQDRKNRSDAWEGNYGKCAMDEET